MTRCSECGTEHSDEWNGRNCAVCLDRANASMQRERDSAVLKDIRGQMVSLNRQMKRIADSLEFFCEAINEERGRRR